MFVMVVLANTGKVVISFVTIIYGHVKRACAAIAQFESFH